MTGGAGYIGSHACLVLLEAGYSVVVVDNLCNSQELALRRVEQISGRKLTFIQGDIRNRAALDDIFNRFSISAVMHFAGLKAVGESVVKPLEYYETNFTGSKVLLQAMQAHGV